MTDVKSQNAAAEEEIKNNPLLGSVPKSPLSYKEKVSFLIQLFIKRGIEFNPQEFKREMVACSRILKEYPDFDFFYSLSDLTNQFNSLLGLTGKYWKPKLQERYKEFLLDKKQKPVEYILEDKPVIDLATEKIKPKTILEFLNEKE